MSRHSLSRYQSLFAVALFASLIVASCSVNSEDASSDDVEQPVAANLDGEPDTALPNERLPNEEQPGEIVDQPQTIDVAISELLNVIAIEGRFVPAYVDPTSGDVIVLAGPDSEQETVRKIGSLDFEGDQGVEIRTIDFEPALLVEALQKGGETILKDPLVDGLHIDWMEHQLVVILVKGSTPEDVSKVSNMLSKNKIAAGTTEPLILISNDEPYRESFEE